MKLKKQTFWGILLLALAFCILISVVDTVISFTEQLSGVEMTFEIVGSIIVTFLLPITVLLLGLALTFYGNKSKLLIDASLFVMAFYFAGEFMLNFKDGGTAAVIFAIFAIVYLALVIVRPSGVLGARICAAIILVLLALGFVFAYTVSFTESNDFTKAVSQFVSVVTILHFVVYNLSLFAYFLEDGFEAEVPAVDAEEEIEEAEQDDEEEADIEDEPEESLEETEQTEE